MTRGCRVLRVITRMNVGGPARHVNMLLRGLSPVDFPQRLLAGRCSRGEAECGPEPSSESRIIASLGRSLSVVGDMRAASALAREISTYAPGIVHSHTAKAGVLLRVVAGRRRKFQTVHTFHGFNFTGHLWPLVGGASRWVERMLAARTDAFIVQSEGQRRVLESVLHARDHGRCHVIPPAVQEEFLTQKGDSRAATREALGYADGDRVLLFAARLAHVKRPMLLLELMQILRRDPRVRLLVAGDGPLRAEFTRAVRQLDLGARVKLIGSRPDLWQFMDAADALLLVSRSEGTPLVLLEAEARGLPIFATDVGSVREMLSPGQILIGANAAPDLMARAVTQLVEERRTGDPLAVAARTRVQAMFSEAALASNITKLYRALAG